MVRRYKKSYKPGLKIMVNDKMQRGYQYVLTYKAGTNIKNGGYDNNGSKIRYTDFEPFYTPAKMLAMGVFEGKYLNDCENEFPREWYDKAKRNTKLSKYADPDVNFFKVKSRLSLHEWKKRGWLPVHKKDKDVRGWFQWYCRYWIGRRIPEVDRIQIKRWKAFKRHFEQVRKNVKGDMTKRKKQRQALLQWSWNCKI